MHRRSTIALAALIIALFAVLCAGCSGKDKSGSDTPWYVASPETPVTRVGTVDRVRALVAFTKSPREEAAHRNLVAQRDAARAAGEEARMAELEAEGAAKQHAAHAQLGGTAPLTNLIDAIRDQLPEVARQANVQMIIEEGGEVPGNAETVDVTDQIEALLASLR